MNRIIPCLLFTSRLSGKGIAHDVRLVLISGRTDELNQKLSGFPVEIAPASVGSVVAVIALVTFLFFMKRFWCKKENRPDSGVSEVICNQ